MWMSFTFAFDHLDVSMAFLSNLSREILYHKYNENVEILVTESSILKLLGRCRQASFLKHFTPTRRQTHKIGSGVVALPGTKDHTCRVGQGQGRHRAGIRWQCLCSLHQSWLIPYLGLDYTTVIYTSMRSKGNVVAIRLHFGPTLYPLMLDEWKTAQCKVPAEDYKLYLCCHEHSMYLYPIKTPLE